MGDTHAVTNQVPPLQDYDVFATDLALAEGVRRHEAEWAVDGAAITIEYGRPSLKGRPDAQLLKEAQRASALSHPRIASVYDVFTDEHGAYLAMELVDGDTLRGFVKGRSQAQAANPEHRATHAARW